MPTVPWASVLAAVVCCTLVFYLIVVLITLFKHLKHLPVKTVLLVTAHPDDECMFFGPVLRGLVKSAVTVYVLCLSSGNHQRKGKIRKDELRRSCKLLGIPNSNVTVIEHSLMPDDPMRCWRKDIIAAVVLKYVTSLSVEGVISFDFYGISGHLNHVSIFSGIRHLRSKGGYPDNCRFYILESVNVLRKYSGVFDVPLAFTASCYVYICSLYDLFIVHRAMNMHRSQLVWFRYLYVLFSRYMIVNTLREMTPHQSRHTTTDQSVLLKQ